MGRQPFGLASPVAWLEREGCEVRCLDLALEPLDPQAIAWAELVAFHLPMHTATRLALAAAERVRALNPGAHLCFYGLYGALNESLLRRAGGDTILGGEFEEGLAALARGLREGRAPTGASSVSLGRLRFLVPERGGLPALERYAKLRIGDETRPSGYTEATRGCKHLCRHCPIVPVYGGTFRVVQAEVVLEDVRRQVAAGARHVTFGDPDFFNGPRHALRIVEALHREFPELTYDVTIKVEHLLAQRAHLARLKETGCLFVTSAVESFDDRTLALLDKGHTRADFVDALAHTRAAGLDLVPTFVAFTPWLTRAGYLDLLRTIEELDLVDHVAPVQYGIRLLVTAGSRLLELDELHGLLGEFDPERLVWPWAHPDPALDRLQADVMRAVREAEREGLGRRATFGRVARLALLACAGGAEGSLLAGARPTVATRATVPFLTEPWYC